MKENYSLKHLNTFGLDAKAKRFLEIDSVEKLKKLLKEKEIQEQEKLVLGGGSNLLFTQDYDGLVIKNNIGGIRETVQTSSEVYVTAGAGVVWHDLVLWAVERGYGGIENLSLIPGTVGAAPIQNIGAYGVELKDVFVELEALDLLEGNLHIFDTEACDFGYRDSIFKREAKGRFIVTSVTLRLSKEPDYNVQYGALQKTLNEMGVKELSVKAVSDAVVRIRETKLPDPAVMGNCGSFFKNPVITQELFERIKNDYPDMPSYPQGEGIVKVAAGWLIEQCGWKGFKEGGVGVHDRQALVLVNLGDGSGHAVRELSERIQRSVLERFKIRLNPEVNII